MSSISPLLVMRGISKRFPGVVALSDANLDVGRGEVVALVGENGAGKSTLMRILGGVYQPDSGEIQFEGVPITIPNVHHAIKLGIAFIHQELNVVDNLDVAANVFLGREPKLGPFGLIDRKRIHAETEPYLKRLGLAVSSRTRLDHLSLAQQQMVEIAKALSVNARLIIMDEPTSSLTLAETEQLLRLICELSDQDISVIYISHRLGEIEHCADRVVVLRDGKNAGNLNREEISHDRIVRLMVGRDVQNFYVQPKARHTSAFLQVRELRSQRYADKTVAFDAGRGEILGCAGLVGAGRSEMAKAIVGLDPFARGRIILGAEPIPLGDPKAAIRRGIYLVPEDRRAEGLVVDMSVRENVTLPSLERFAPFHFVQRKLERRATEEQMAALKIRSPSAETQVLNLSGGNQQKVVLAKWLAMSPKVMILDEPTRGVDVGAKAEIYRLMRELAEQGAVILMISSDMEEVLNISDRVIVMHEGEISGALERADCTEENIMQLAVGKRIAVARPAFTP